jgi:hypothetical protein
LKKFAATGMLKSELLNAIGSIIADGGTIRRREGRKSAEKIVTSNVTKNAGKSEGMIGVMNTGETADN